MPKIEDLERLGSIAFLIGNKALPKEISKEDNDRFKSVFTDEYMASSIPTDDNDMPSIDDLNSLNEDNLDLPEDLDDNITADVDNLDLPEDLGDNITTDVDNLDLPEDLGDNITADVDNLDLPEDLDDNITADVDNLDLPEDLGDNITADIDNLDLPEDLDNITADVDDLDLPEDPELEEKIASDISNEDSNSSNIQTEKLDALDDDLPVPDSLNTSDDIDNLDINDISDSLDDILDNDLMPDSAKDEISEAVETPISENTEEDLGDLDVDNLIPDSTKDEISEAVETPISENTEEDLGDLDVDNSIPDSAKDEISEAVETPISENTEEDLGDLDVDNLIPDSTKDEILESQEEVKSNAVTDNSKNEYDNATELNDNSHDTLLPAPEMADSLPLSKYEDVDKDIDHNKVIDTIKNLSPLTQYHVLDIILNEKSDKAFMKNLLMNLEKGESNESITELINEELGFTIKESKKISAWDLIPIPDSLKDYARIIRLASVFLIAFVGIVLFSFKFIYKPIKANQYYKQGLIDISEGYYDKAERNFYEGNKLKPNQIKWYNKYARAYIDRNSFHFALDKIQSALNIKPRDFETRMTFGYYYRKKGEKELSEEDYISGEDLYNNMLLYTKDKKEKISIYDELGILMISRAKNLNQHNYYNLAYNNYRDMVNFFGDNVIARKRVMLIKIYEDDYNSVRAIQNHIDAMKKGYIDDDVYPKLAKYLLDKEDFYEARTLFEKLLSLYPENLESIVGYADYESRLKHYDRVRDILIKNALPLYDINPFYSGKEYIYNMLGQMYYNLGEYGNAIKNFNEALAINEVYPDANFNLGNVYFYQDEDYAKAKEYYQRAYDNLAPNLRSDQLLYNLSWIYYLDNEFDRSFEGFNALFQKNPSNSLISYALGNSLLHLDKANLANGFYRNALTQILSKVSKLGRLEMRTERDFILVSYLASLYNNIGVSYAYNSTVTNTIQNEQEAFKYFVLASEYFDQIRTSNIDLDRMERRTVSIDNQNVGVATYNIMSMQGRRNLKEVAAVDDYIPKDMYYLR